MKVLEAPKFTGDRSAAREFLSDLAADLSSTPVTIRFVDRSIATTSFVDELVHELFIVRDAQSVVFENLNDQICAVAYAAVEEFGVAGRFSCS